MSGVAVGVGIVNQDPARVLRPATVAVAIVVEFRLGQRRSLGGAYDLTSGVVSVRKLLSQGRSLLLEMPSSVVFLGNCIEIRIGYLLLLVPEGQPRTTAPAVPVRRCYYGTF